MGNGTSRRFSLSRKTSIGYKKGTGATTTKRKRNQSGKDLLMSPFEHDACGNKLNECQSIKRIRMVLHWYQSMRQIHSDSSQIHKLLIEYVNTYTNLLNDYHHIIVKHLSSNKLQNNENFLIIHNKFSKHMQCNIKTCKQYTRVCLTKAQNNGHMHRISLNIAHKYTDIIIDFYVELLDVIHCYFMHSIDLGLRVCTIESETEDSYTHSHSQSYGNDNTNLLHTNDCEQKELLKDQSMIDYEHKDTNNYNDRELEYYKKILIQKRNTFKKMRGISMDKHNKFFGDISTQNGNETEYCFGYRYYYWDWYKNNENKDVFWNFGRKYAQMYIESKYDSLKQEITENALCNISVIDFDKCYNKAMNYLNKSEIIKSAQSNVHGYGNCHYEIEDNEAISIEHIISVILYTDIQTLSLAFAMHNRNNTEVSEFANWNRFLRETVELYGETLEDNHIKTFYFGLSKQIIFNKFRVMISCPISTSTELSVILLMSDSNSNGIVLDLSMTAQPMGNKLKCFNCALFSCFAEENERLFIGGYAPIQISSIRIIKTHKNYDRFLVSLGYFDTILSGAYDIENGCNESDSDTINQLIYQLSMDGNGNKELMKFPIYISAMFEQFVVRKESIYIDLQGLNWYYKSFVELLMTKECQNLIKFGFIAKLFKNCKNITVKMLMYDSVSKTHICELLKEIQLLEGSAVQTIKLELIRVNVNRTKWNEFENDMKKLKCALKLTGKGNEGYKELLITLK